MMGTGDAKREVREERRTERAGIKEEDEEEKYDR